MKAVINVDWVEVYCLEPDFKGTPEYYTKQGYIVKVQDYGTRMYKQVFDIFSPTNRPLYHIVRDPYSVRGVVKNGIFPRGACHIKIHNNMLYEPDWCVSFLAFLIDNGYTFQCISRIDVCCDLQKFADGTLPKTLVAGYFQNKYHKVNQPNFSARGVDRGEKLFNYVAWGSPSSAVTSTIYDKTKELNEVRDKPYIREQWQSAGFDDNRHVWRVEIRIKSDGRRLINMNTGELKELHLTDFDSKEKVYNQFLHYADHYFRWKNAKPGVSKKNCKDKILFDKIDPDTWKVYRNTGESGSARSDKIAVNYLHQFKEKAVSFTNEEQLAINHAIMIILRHKSLSKWFGTKFN